MHVGGRGRLDTSYVTPWEVSTKVFTEVIYSIYLCTCTASTYITYIILLCLCKHELGTSVLLLVRTMHIARVLYE